MKRCLIPFFLIFFIVGCFFGPVKELKNQIEDTWDADTPIVPPTELIDISNSKKFSRLWTAHSGTESLWEIDANSYDIHTLGMFVYEDFLFTLNHDGLIKKFNLNTGSLLWEKDFNFKVSAGLSGDSDALYFATSEGDLWSLDHDGKKLWKTYVGGQVHVKPLPNTSFVVVKLNFNKFVQINISDGSIKWDYQAPNPPLTINYQGDMIFANGVIYSGLPGGKLIAIEAETGSMIWEVNVASPKGLTEIERANDVTSQPVIDGSIIYSVSSKGKITSFDRRTSQKIWDRTLSSFVGLNLYGNNLIVVHESGSIYSLNNEVGKSNWRNADLQYRNIGKGIIIEDLLSVGDFDGYLHLIDLFNGKISSRIKLSGSQILDNMISLGDNKLIAMDVDGNIFCIEINDNVEIKSTEEINENDISNNTDLIDKVETRGHTQDKNYDETSESSWLDKLKIWKKDKASDDENLL
jgi:outer membrane protein assembly factor BamB